ncbi:DUF910 domain-containing protein [Halalkalibacillus sediminis]|uniref:DUF910 domain-containing protein n=1 Tax=Halalkalibacillus sediminis TaxID=2018042 RepID=A0A2I0QXC9_9BACI|nr:YqgQ family protein [Halalkalibacillus sediminis]PKR78992.1 DUF910 domain-containing protein [Halalkalibacillus sediminis]
MRTLFDVQQLLKRFGTFIYLGDRNADIEMMEEEIKDLYKNGLISSEEYTQVLLVLKKERKDMG